ncbi:MAG: ABC transporter ATP-binding protein, partial [Clostridia bacterium]
MLKLNSICKNYVMSKDLTVNALKNVTLAFRPCEFVAVLGPSGCGKTTLLNIIGGLDHYTSGDLMINGKSTKEYTDSDWDNYRNKCIGFVFQSYNLIPHQTVLQNVELALTLSGISKADRLARAKHALDTVGLTTEYDKRPNQLSGGQMQRVAIARSIVNNPTILLADEPTGALDSETSIQVMNLLREIAKDRLVIMVTHNKDLADAYATRIVNLLDGQVVSDTLPLTDTELDAPIAEQIVEQAEEPSDKKVKTPKKKTSMSFLTALSLSFNNLMTKKGRTIMTSFAGSIGIVGVALILALNYGFNTYISKMQSDTLSGYPVTISKAAMDYDAIYEQSQNIGKDDNTGKFPVGDDNIHIYDPSDSGMGNAIHYNLIDKDYYQFINDFEAQENAKSEQKRLINGVQYSYASSLNLVRKQKTLDGKETYVLVKNGSGAGSSMETMMGTSSSVFQEALSNTDFVWSQYDKLLGEYPKNKNEVALIVDSRNRISTSTMDALGLQYSSKSSQDKITYEDVPFEDILHTQFSLIYNDLFYEKNDALNSFAPMSGLTNDELQVKLQE